MRRVFRLYAAAFSGLPGEVWRLATGLLLNRAGTMVLPFLSLYLVRELRYETEAAAAALFAFGMGSVVGAYAGGALSGRWGTLAVQIWSLVLAGAAFLALSQVRSFVAMVAAVFVAGALADAYRPACMSAAAEASPPELRPRGLGLMRLAANAGMAIGPAVGGLLAGIDYRWIFVGEAVTCWLAAVWLFATLRGTGGRAPGEREAVVAGPSPWTDGPFLALLALIFLSALVLFQVFNSLPLYLTSAYALGERQVGLIFAFNAALIVAFEMVLIKLTERRDPALVLGFGMFLMCAGFGLLPLGRGLEYAALTVVVWTAGEMLAFPFSNVLVVRRAAPGRTSQAMGLYMAVFSVAILVAPAGLPVLERFGGDALWAVCGLAGVPLWLGMLLLAPRLRHPAGSAERGAESK